MYGGDEEAEGLPVLLPPGYQETVPVGGPKVAVTPGPVEMAPVGSLDRVGEDPPRVVEVPGFGGVSV